MPRHANHTSPSSDPGFDTWKPFTDATPQDSVQSRSCCPRPKSNFRTRRTSPGSSGHLGYRQGTALRASAELENLASRGLKEMMESDLGK